MITAKGKRRKLLFVIGTRQKEWDIVRNREFRDVSTLLFEVLDSSVTGLVVQQYDFTKRKKR